MNMPQIDFITAIKFAKHAAGTIDVRYYLNGVHLKFQGADLTLTATDGHRCARVKLTVADWDENWPQGEYIVDNDSLKALVTTFKTRKADADKWLTVQEGDSDLQLLVSNGEQTVKLACIDGRFPDVTRVLPQSEPKGADVVGINLEYLAEGSAALKLLAHPKFKGSKLETWDGKTGVRLTAPTNHGGFKLITEPAFVFIMPMRL